MKVEVIDWPPTVIVDGKVVYQEEPLETRPGITEHPNGLTVREFKQIVAGWPEKTPVGDDATVWLGSARGTNEAREVWPLDEGDLLLIGGDALPTGPSRVENTEYETI